MALPAGHPRPTSLPPPPRRGDHFLQVPLIHHQAGGNQVPRGVENWPVGVMSSTGSSWAGVRGPGVLCRGRRVCEGSRPGARLPGRFRGPAGRAAPGDPARRAEGRRGQRSGPRVAAPPPRPEATPPSGQAPPPRRLRLFPPPRPARPAASAISVARWPPFCRGSCVSAGARLGPRERGFVRFGNGRVGAGPGRGAGGREGVARRVPSAATRLPLAGRPPSPPPPRTHPPPLGPLGGPGATGRPRDRGRRRLRGGEGQPGARARRRGAWAALSPEPPRPGTGRRPGAARGRV